MENRKLEIKDSLCSTCKFGLCFLQEAASLMEANFPLGDSPQPPPGEGIQDLGWDDDEHEEHDARMITEKRVCSICYWTPEGWSQDSPIANPTIVRQCNRYVKEVDDPTDQG